MTNHLKQTAPDGQALLLSDDETVLSL